MARNIVITSGKGGVGKTTVTANLGRALAALNQRVVMLDTDLGLNNLDVLMDIENKVVYDLIDVIENRCRAKQALIEDNLVKGLFVLPSAHAYDKSIVTGQNIKAVINLLSVNFDYVLIDCPAGIETGFHRAVQAASEAIVVTTPHISSIRDADKVIGILKSYQMKSVYVVVNRARGDLILNSEMVGFDDVGQLLKQLPVGIIPEDDDVNLLSNLGLKASAHCEGKEAFALLAQNIHFGTNVMYDVTRKYKGFFGGIKRSLRKMI